ncbi:hypothetical protein BD560DRAFT_388136 [Blakeslea trispora]|nr:hypothetical protein BD560DRAFT_388136 [Blakeslea trispora]
MDIDLRTIRFVDSVNDNLICCICQTPFIEPVISTCGHTFCQHCIFQALESSPLCPIDRNHLSTKDVVPAAKIISNMVNELLVYCPRQEQGCPHIGQRQYIESHLKHDCLYIMASCELEECKELLLRKDLPRHAETCKYRVLQCTMCKENMCSYELEDHYEHCPSETITCQYCHTSRPRSEYSSHVNDCPQCIVFCDHVEFGCSWSNERQLLKEHLSHCSYETIKSFLHQHKATEKSLKHEIQQLHTENESLKRNQYDMGKKIESVTQQLDLMFPGHFVSSENTRHEPVLSESQRLNNEIESLSASIASLELKQNMALMTETFRLQEELQSLRAICHGLRMQMHYLMMERKTTSSGTGAAGTNNGASGDTSAANTLGRMRAWLGKFNKK